MFDELTRRSYSEHKESIIIIIEENSPELESLFPCRESKTDYQKQELNDDINNSTNQNPSDLLIPKIDWKTKVLPDPREYLSMNPISYYIVTLVVYFVVVGFSIISDDLNLLFGVIGSTVSSSMVITFPGIFYIINTQFGFKMNRVE